jgi:pyrroline-5-carboxylate reductase
MTENIGIIGFGNMGSAIAERIKTKYKVWVFDKDKEKTKNIFGINVADNLADLANQADVIILAVKPQDFDAVLNEMKNCAQDKFIISIAAGISTEYIERKLGNARVVRTMPNIPAKIGEGMTCLCKGKFTSEEDLSFVEELFSYLGKTLILREGLMHAATAVSGSGPAYVCDYMITEALEPNNIPEHKKREFLKDFKKAAESVGFNSEEAELLVNTSYTGTINFIKKTNIAPEELEKQVTSRGGTTEAALLARRNGSSWEEAVKVAKRRAEELSKKE